MSSDIIFPLDRCHSSRVDQIRLDYDLNSMLKFQIQMGLDNKAMYQVWITYSLRAFFPDYPNRIAKQIGLNLKIGFFQSKRHTTLGLEDPSCGKTQGHGAVYGYYLRKIFCIKYTF